MVAHLTVEQRQLALRLQALGLSLRDIGREVGCSHELVRILARGARSAAARSRSQHDAFIAAYGQDIRSWDGHPVMRDIRKVSTLTGAPTCRPR